MTTERIKEIQKTTGYPDSVSVQQALLQVWNEVTQESNRLKKLGYSEGVSQPGDGVENAGTNGWLKLNLVVNPKNGTFYLSGDRKPGRGDMPFEALDYIAIKKKAPASL